MNYFRKKTILVTTITIVLVLGVSVGLTVVIASLSSQTLPTLENWTPLPSVTLTTTPTMEEIKGNDVEPPTPAKTESIKQNCTYPIDYWIEHEELWPLGAVLGNDSYSIDDILTILTENDREVQEELILQMYFANLNILYGADREPITEYLEGAQVWIGENGENVIYSDEVRSSGIQLAGALSQFNFGIIGPGACSPYQAASLTPSPLERATLTPTPSLSPTFTQTRPFITFTPTPTSTATKRESTAAPTSTPRPVTSTSAPPTSTDRPTDPPTQAPTQPPTSAPPEDTPVPTQPPDPTDPPQPPTPTPAG